ncbi:MAG: DUF5916 domain-containing protein [Saprospiraceae bacterium]
MKIDNDGWSAEVKIPYSALRFPKEELSVWAINFGRQIRRLRRIYYWSPVNNTTDNSMLFSGHLSNLENLTPPTRLFIIPYSSIYLNNYSGQNDVKVKAGADIKWGISESFTLDAILVPDFGQTSYDNVQYILGPFEQEFSEKRSFFTEGVDLFNKAGLVYTRRIGQTISSDVTLNENESIDFFPSQTNLLNATKISGRTKNGYGIGVMNAITEKASAIIKNKETGSIRNVTITPLTNFNVAVIDKRYGNNNSVSLINTNVTRAENYDDANVSALVTNNYFDKNSYNFKNELKYSYINSETDKKGYWLSTTFQKTEGKNRFGGSARYVSKDYEINDFGINYYTDYLKYNAYYYYKILEPTKLFNSFSTKVNLDVRVNNTSQKPEQVNFYWSITTNDKNNNYRGFGIGTNPVTTYDHYEPRTDGRYMKLQRDMFLWGGYSPNFNKKFLIEFYPELYIKEKKGTWGYDFSIYPRWRINDKLLVKFGIYLLDNYKDYGFIDNIDGNIIIGVRDQKTLENSLNLTYNINPKLSFNVDLRHYLTTGKYLEYYDLLEDGDYASSDYSSDTNDFNYNDWNIDVLLSYWFAPGSQLVFLYRNSADYFISQYNFNYGENIHNIFSEDKSNIISLRINYNIDYNYWKTRLKKTKS